MFTIAFEGLEGCGKSTAVEMLKRFIYSELANAYALAGDSSVSSIVVGSISTCSNSEFGVIVRNTLRSNGHSESGKLTDKEQALLILTDRLLNDRLVVRPHIALGNPYIYDRYLDSTLYLQGYEPNGALGVKDIITYAKAIHPALVTMADVTISLQPGIEILQQRLQSKRSNARDNETFSKLNKYHALYNEYSNLRSSIDFKTIDGNDAYYLKINNQTSIENVMQSLASIIAKLCYKAKVQTKPKSQMYPEFEQSIKSLITAYGVSA